MQPLVRPLDRGNAGEASPVDAVVLTRDQVERALDEGEPGSEREFDGVDRLGGSVPIDG